MTVFTLADLERHRRQPRGSAAGGVLYGEASRRRAGAAAKKLGEEAVEAVIAAVTGDAGALTREAADVLYHLVVCCAERASPSPT